MAAGRPERRSGAQRGGGEFGPPCRLEHRFGQVGPVHPPGRQPGRVAGQRRLLAIRVGEPAGMHARGAEVIRLLVAVQREQDLRRLALQLRGIGGRQAARARDQPGGGTPCAAARRRFHRAVQLAVARQRPPGRFGLLRHRDRRPFVAARRGQGHGGWGRRRRFAARQADQQQRVDGPRVRQVRPLREPVLQFRGAGAGEAAQVAVGQQFAQHGAAERGHAVHLAGFAHRLGDVAARLEGEDAADARRLAGRQRLRQGDAGRAAGRDARDRQRRFIGACLGMPRLCFGVRLRGRGTGQQRNPGEKRPGGGKTGERRTDPSHGRNAYTPPP